MTTTINGSTGINQTSFTATTLNSSSGAINATLGATTPSTVAATTISATAKIETSATPARLVARTSGTGNSLLELIRNADGAESGFKFSINGITNDLTLDRFIGGGSANVMGVVNSTGAVSFASGLAVTGALSATGNVSLNGGAFQINDGSAVNKGQIGWQSFASNVVGFGSTSASNVVLATNSTVQATLDTSGNLGLGVTPKSWAGAAFKGFEIGTANGNFVTGGGASNIFLGAGNYFNSGWKRSSGTDAACLFNATAGAYYWNTAAAGAVDSAITWTTAMTLDASGNLLVGATARTFTEKVKIDYSTVGQGIVLLTGGTASSDQIVFNNGNGTVGKITTSGSATAFTTSSDKDLKTDIGIVESTDVIYNTVVHDFTWNAGGEADRGVFAQDAYLVKPSAVHVGTDERNELGQKVQPWGVDYSKYVPDLIVTCQQQHKAIQEQQAQITALTQRLAAAGIV